MISLEREVVDEKRGKRTVYGHAKRVMVGVNTAMKMAVVYVGNVSM